ncbi:MAG: serine/threonine-protein kinase [Polyangiaceae bacterium]
MSGESTASTSPGSVLAGKFRVERELGRGAMGVVLLATDQLLGREVALKLLEPSLAHDETARARLLREANVASRLTGRHVARVLEAGLLEDGAPYVAFEHLEGETLEAVVDRHERLPVPVAVGFVLEALDGLQEAHDLGLVHRDLKPANLFLARTKDGPAIVKVLDFGLARAEDSARLTATGDTLGSPAYMAPEQLRAGETVGPAADVWALGVTLFELLTGELPFAGDSVPAIAHKILRAPPTALAAVRDGVPAEIEQVITRCLCKAPAERFADAREMRAALEAACPRDPSALAFRTTAFAGPGDTRGPERGHAAPRPRPSGRDTHRRPRAKRAARARAGLFAAVTLGTLAVGALVAMAIARQTPPTVRDADVIATSATQAPPPAQPTTHATPVTAPQSSADAAAADVPADAPDAARPRRAPTLRERALAQATGGCACVIDAMGKLSNLCQASSRRDRHCVCSTTVSITTPLCHDPLSTGPCDYSYPVRGVSGSPCEGHRATYFADGGGYSEPRTGRIVCGQCGHYQSFGGGVNGEPCYGFDDDDKAVRGRLSCLRGR